MMKLPDKIKRSIEKRLEEVKLGTFSQDTIKLLLIEIREYLPQHSALRDVAHFVAHPERDRGLILETVNYAYNRSRVLFRQLDTNKSGKGLELNIDKLPGDIYETVTWHFIHIKPNSSKLLRFRRSFVLDRTSNSYRARKPVTDKIIKHIQEAISILSLQPALSQATMIQEIVAAVRHVGLGDYSQFIVAHQNEIMVCVLSMLHQSSFILKDGNTAEAHLGSDSIVTDKGKVHLAATVKTELSPVSIGFTLISSEVTIKESFSDSMFNMAFGFPRITLDKSDHIAAVRNEQGCIVFVKNTEKSEPLIPPDR